MQNVAKFFVYLLIVAGIAGILLAVLGGASHLLKDTSQRLRLEQML